MVVGIAAVGLSMSFDASFGGDKATVTVCSDMLLLIAQRLVWSSRQSTFFNFLAPTNAGEWYAQRMQREWSGVAELWGAVSSTRAAIREKEYVGLVVRREKSAALSQQKLSAG